MTSVLLLLVACGSADETRQESAATDEVGKAADVSADTQTAAPKPPPDLLDALWQGVDEKKWDIDEALIGNMESMLAQQSVDKLYAQPVEVFELTGVFNAAKAYIQASPDADSAEKIRRLLSRLLPSEELLNQLSVEADQYQDRSTLPGWLSPISTAHADGLNCREVTRAAYPENWSPRVDAGDFEYDCFVRSLRAPGSSRREYIYVPRVWLDTGDGRERFAALTLNAINDAISRYTSFGLGMGDAGRISAILTEGDHFGAYMFVDAVQMHRDDDGSMDRDACLIHVMQSAYGLSPAEYKQAVAHEVFHCFQFWNFPQQMNSTYGQGNLAGLTRWSEIRDWWSEGSAEYFSNTVYPDVNFEWRTRELFDRVSVDTPITRMIYESSLFFQFAANRMDNWGVLNMIRSLPTRGGIREQAEALARYSDMEVLFHDFGKAYLDEEVVDSSGDPIPPVDLNEGEEIEVDAEERIDSKPFVLHRAVLKFPGSAPRDVEIEEEEVDGRTSVQRKEEGVEHPWQEEPERVGTGLSVCEAKEKKYRLLMTSAGPEDPRYRIKIKLEEADEMAEDMHDAAYRYRNFAGAIKYLDKGPSSMSPDLPPNVQARLDEKMPRVADATEEQKNKLHCQMSCALKCICDNPQMHSNRVVTLDECYRYNPAGRLKVKSFDGETKTRCEFQLEDINQNIGGDLDIARSSAFKVIESYCALGCAQKCGRIPEGMELDEVPIAP